ncbi:hypothetical protein BgiBS90_013977 [Biomphalaria glabrata]|nr:hypothetical protein BgiBS90_013977 [Biomphalaria glabrata]
MVILLRSEQKNGHLIKIRTSIVFYIVTSSRQEAVLYLLSRRRAKSGNSGKINLCLAVNTVITSVTLGNKFQFLQKDVY